MGIGQQRPQDNGQGTACWSQPDTMCTELGSPGGLSMVPHGPQDLAVGEGGSLAPSPEYGPASSELPASFLWPASSTSG